MASNKADLAAIAVISVAVLVVASVAQLSNEQNARDLSWNDLSSIDRTSAETAMSLERGDTVKIQNLTAFALLHAGVPRDIIQDYPFDWNMMSRNTGLMDGIGKGFTETADRNDLYRVLKNSEQLARAFSGGVKEPYFHDGLPQPVFGYTPESDDYSNENSQTIRYCVFVETEYDTDSDGKRDLIEVFLQIPRAAAEGRYDSPVILIPCPYDHGVTYEGIAEPRDAYDMSRLYSQPDARTPEGSVSAWDAAMSAKPSDWHYGEEGREYEYQHMCDYFIPRGYAVAICGLLGSYGSEGYPCTGLDLELLAVKSVIEWFDGDAVGYTSRDGLVTTGADWCSGDVGMYGVSYLGTMQIGAAAMGIDNLKTVMPCNAISSWYEYAYQKGGLTNIASDRYISYLAGFVSTAKDPFSGDCYDYMQKLSYDETVLGGQYTDGTSAFWKDRDYSRMDIDTGTSVLLVHGINDYNVKMCEFERTVEMFRDSGIEMKTFLHQGAHQSSDNEFVFLLGNDDGMVTANKWYSHYLFGRDTGTDGWPDIQVQSNLDGSWSAYDSLDPKSEAVFKYAGSGTETFYPDSEEYDGFEIDIAVADRDMTILGGELRLRLSSQTDGIPSQPVSAVVKDMYGPGMKAFRNVDFSTVETEFADSGDLEADTVWFGSTLSDCRLSEFALLDTTSREICIGSVGMDYYGETVDLDSMRAQDRVPGEMYEYVIDMQPTAYTLKAGHTITLLITGFEPYTKQDLEEEMAHYDVTVDLSSVELTLYLA